ncbi:unnamed protein product, partial [Rotaria sp. Silwood1]
SPNEYLFVTIEKEIPSMSMELHDSSISAPWHAITNLNLVVEIDFDYQDEIYRTEKYSSVNMIEINNRYYHICKIASNNQIEYACSNRQQLKLANNRQISISSSSSCILVNLSK